VNIWQPNFSNPNNMRSKPDKDFGIFSLQFKLSGSFMSRNVSKGIDDDNDEDINYERKTEKLTSCLNYDDLIKNDNEKVKIGSSNSNPTNEIMQNVRIFACACVLDPSCSTVIISYSDGRLRLWPLIGAAATDKTVSYSCHVLDMKLSIFCSDNLQ
jgi:hypothetical protein